MPGLYRSGSAWHENRHGMAKAATLRRRWLECIRQKGETHTTAYLSKGLVVQEPGAVKVVRRDARHVELPLELVPQALNVVVHYEVRHLLRGSGVLMYKHETTRPRQDHSAQSGTCAVATTTSRTQASANTHPIRPHQVCGLHAGSPSGKQLHSRTPAAQHQQNTKHHSTDSTYPPSAMLCHVHCAVIQRTS